MCKYTLVKSGKGFMLLFFIASSIAIILMGLAAIVGLGMITNQKCKYECLIKNIYVINLAIWLMSFLSILGWKIKVEQNEKTTITFGIAIWIYLSMVLVQAGLKFHFVNYYGHLQKIRTV